MATARVRIEPAPSSNVIAVIRVSTDRQDMERQHNDIRYIAGRKDLNVVRTIELFGVSGTATEDDPQMQKVLHEIRTNPNIGGIAVSALDRLFRPGKHYGQFGILDHFQNHGKVIWSQREGFIDPATDEGYDKCIQAGGRGGAEWRTLRQRSMDGKAVKVDQGIVVSAPTIFGYRYVPKHPRNEATCGNHPKRVDSDKRCGQFYEVGPEHEVETIRHAFDLRAKNTPTYRIACELNQRGMRSATGKLWSRQTVQQLLRQTAYIGKLRYNDSFIAVPKLIDEETFARVQEVTRCAKQQWIGRPSRIYLLRGYIWCAHCGHRIITKNSDTSKEPYYRCGYRNEHPPLRYLCTKARKVFQSKVERVTWDALWNLLKSPEVLLSMGNAYFADMAAERNSGKEPLAEEQSRLKADEQRVIEMTRAGMYSVAEGNAQLRTIRARLKEIAEEMRATGKVANLPPLRQVEAALREITTGPEPQSYDDRRNILEGFTDLHVEYDAENNEVTITGKLAIDGASESAGSGPKKCKRGIGADPQTERYHDYKRQKRRA